MTDTFDWFAKRGIRIWQSGADREYAAEVSDADGLDVVMLSAGEIPRDLAAGRIDLGVTGLDLILERLASPESDDDTGVGDIPPQVRIAAEMKLGFATLVVAVPAIWIDVETMHDLDEVAFQFRQRHGRPLRVATKYHNLVRDYFRRHGVADYRLVDSQGATEAAPKNLAAEVIADITSSGATLRDNHLRELADEPILRSQAVLAVSKTAAWDEPKSAALRALEERLSLMP